MIVVTIIIAAVVSAFAGGFAEGQKNVPVTQFDMRLYHSFQVEHGSNDYTFTAGGQSYGVRNGIPVFVVVMKSGDPIKGSDLKLVTYRTLLDGTVQKHEFDPSNSSQYHCSGGVGTLCWNYGYTNEGWSDSMVSPGMTAETQGASNVDDVLGDEVSSLPVGASIDINIVHVPTNSIIYHQEMTVQ